MGTILSKIYKLERKNFALIILLQLLVILILTALLISGGETPSILSAQGNTFSESITSDIKSCLLLSEEERPLCAKIIGKKIAENFTTPSDRLKECLKFRPYSYTLQCEEGLFEGQIPTPSPSPSTPENVNPAASPSAPEASASQ